MTLTDQPLEPASARRSVVPPETAKRILISLIFPTTLMPLIQSISNVALPTIRDEFSMPADIAAWVWITFTLPFMILSPVYGRLSDGIGKRRLLLAGSIVFTIGTAITVFSPELSWFMVGRAIQGIGTAGMMPLAMAFISEIFDPRTRGWALGLWSTTGPATAGVGPLIGGFLVSGWGWRTAIAPPLLTGLITFFVIYRWVPPGLSAVRDGFLRKFDWAGIGLMAGCFTVLLFFLSSRPITGVEPLRDWRLLGISLLFGVLFLWWESRRADPFMDFKIFRSLTFSLATFGAAMRLATLVGLSFLLPLYLADVRQLNPVYIGFLSAISPGSMALMVFKGGQLSDRWGSRWPTTIGLAIQLLTAFAFFLLPEDISIWVIVLVLVVYGMGSGFSLASLHRAAMVEIPEQKLGAAAGLYGMLRFLGGLVGSALAGVILQHFLDQPIPLLAAYQNTYLCFTLTALFGAVGGLLLRETPPQT